MARIALSRSPELFVEPPPPDAGKQPELRALLQQTFGHRDFRPHQQRVCEAAATGRDVLLVMPTGAGKSLCYQLPALARGGTALVISPLIALMDDQASKLSALKLRVARIHSGLPRESLREAARAYLDGSLDFLFIAPERLRVPGFPEMLARRKPALVAIDEAHCISQWGHDFRPDYRTLGNFLPALRPSPIIALTATATPTVQGDILRALHLDDPAVFITGFRRHNLHIEVVETSKPQRLDLMRKLLAPETARPAIVYAQSRKAAEEIAGALNECFPAAAYHAGLDPGTRDRVQRAFLSGNLGVVVATVAFGMGVDKADVRTVIHAALPGSVEAYYQEIGRAGRDGNASRAILLHSFADRRTQEFLLERNYPPVPEIERVLNALHEGVNTLPHLQQHLTMGREIIEQSIDKLLIQGAVVANLDGTVNRTEGANWKQSYEQQIGYRRAQIDKIVAFAEGCTCRMAALIHHFGDRTDSGIPCGNCDVCKPEGAVSADAHQPSADERSEIRSFLKALEAGPRSSGKIFTDLAWKDRRDFDNLTNALARAGLLSITSDSFRTEDGRDVTYRKLSLTPEGRETDDDALSTVWLRSQSELEGKRNRPRLRQSYPAQTVSRTANGEVLTEAQAELEGRLKVWRLDTARSAGAPPFTVFHDSVLRAIAQIAPKKLAQLESIRGIGQDKSNRYGADLLALCRGEEVVIREPSQIPSPKLCTTSRPSTPKLTGTAQQSFLTERERASLSGPNRNANADTVTKTLVQRVPNRPLTSAEQLLEAKVRSWRGNVATGDGLPSFFVLSDTALKQIVVIRPKTIAELSSVPGFTSDKVNRYGAALIDLCRDPEYSPAIVADLTLPPSQPCEITRNA